MHFVKDEVNETKELLKEIEKEEKRQDQLGIEETKQPEKEKPIPKTVKVTKDEWLDATVKTLVNLRKQPNKTAEVLATVKGGEIIKVSSSFSHPEFEKAQYKGKEGYIVKEYVRKI